MANILEKTEQIRHAVLGKDIRESMAAGIEAINNEVVDTTSRQNAIDANENDRIIAENDRSTSEQLRKTSEIERNDSEQNRTSEFQQIKNDYNTASKFNVVTYSDWVYIASEDTNTFNIAMGIFNPLLDIAELSQEGVLLSDGDNYTRTGSRIDLSYILNKDEKINVRVFKGVINEPPSSDGSNMMNRSISKMKLSDDVVEIIDSVPIIKTQLNDIITYNIKDYSVPEVPTTTYVVDTVRLQADVLTANGVLLVPAPFIFKIDNVIEFQGNMVVEGSGYNSRIAPTFNDISKYVFKFTNQLAKNVGVKNLMINGNFGSKVTGNGIYSTVNQWFNLENVRIHDLTGIGVKYENVYLGELKNCHITGCDIGIYIDLASSLNILNCEITYNRLGIYDIGGVTRIFGGYIESNFSLSGVNEVSTTMCGGIYKAKGELHMLSVYLENNGTIIRKDTGKIGKNKIRIGAFYDFDIMLENMDGKVTIYNCRTNLNPGGIHLINSKNCKVENLCITCKDQRALWCPPFWADINSYDNTFSYNIKSEDTNIQHVLMLGLKFKNIDSRAKDENVLSWNDQNLTSQYKPSGSILNTWALTNSVETTDKPIGSVGYGSKWDYTGNSTWTSKYGVINGVNDGSKYSFKCIQKITSDVRFSVVANAVTITIDLQGSGDYEAIHLDLYSNTDGTTKNYGVMYDFSTAPIPKVFNAQFYKNLKDINFISSALKAPSIPLQPMPDGTKVENSNPTAGGYSGWYCFAGVWKGYGLIQA